LPEQKAISNLLGKLDEKIELNEQMAQNLEAIGSTTFKHWFIDFEFPNEEGKPYKSSGGEMVHNGELGEEIPKGWEVGRLDRFIELEKGRKPKDTSQSFIEGYKPQILIEALNGGISTYANPEGMLIVSELDPIMVMDGASSGRVAIGYEGVLGSTLSKIVCISDSLTSLYVYFYLKRYELDMRQNTTGTSIPHSDKQRMMNYRVALPAKTLVQTFQSLIGSMLYTIIANRKESVTLSKIRDSLIPKLMSGKIRVPAEVR